MKDITERKQSEAMQESQEHLNLVRVQKRTQALEQSQAILRQQFEQAQLLGTITQRIRHSLDLNETLATAVTEVRQTLEADRALIFQLRPDRSGVVIEEAVASGYPVTVEMLFADECFPVECYEYYRQGQPRIVPDVLADEWANCLVEFMQQVQVKSKLVAPIIQRNGNESRVWGLLIVHSCSHLRQWQLSEASFLQQISNQLAVAIQQAELYRQLQAELSERQRIEAALQQSEALFRSLSESSPIAIFRTDAQNQFIYTNPRCQALFGFSAEEALGENWRRFVHSEDLETVLPQWSAAAAAKQEFVGELRNVHPDGSIRLLQLRTAPILATEDQLVGQVGTVEDITERRAIEQVKNEFISIVSHELRTPLASIRGALGLLASKVLQDDPNATQHMLQVAEIEAERLVRLVSDILDLERLGSSKVTLDKQWCNAETLLQRSQAAMQPIADENQMTIVLASQSVEIWVDPDRIMQTLVNLLSNAIKFSPPQSQVTLTAQVHESLEVGGDDRVLFQVQDHGRGIPSEKLETIFGRFQQVDTSDARRKGGTGLGLAICRNIVEQHDGQIWAESILGKGSTFYFTVPLARRSQNVSPASFVD